MRRSSAWLISGVKDYVIYGQNIQMHKMFISIGIRKTRNTDDSLGSGTKLLLPSGLLGIWHEKRETHNFFLRWLFHLTQQTRVRTPQQTTGLASSRLASSKSQSQLTAFIQNHLESQPIVSGHDVIHIPSPISSLGFLLWHLWLSHPPRACVNICVNVCTYPCTKPKGS